MSDRNSKASAACHADEQLGAGPPAQTGPRPIPGPPRAFQARLPRAATAHPASPLPMKAAIGTEPKVRILHVDDHEVVRRGLAAVVQSEFKPAEVIGVHDAPAALNVFQKSDWNLVVLDISMPGRGGVDLLREMKSLRPHVPVLILSVMGEEHYATRILKLGASGYVRKDASMEELIAAIRTCLNGHRHISKGMGQHLARMVADGADRPRHELLSDREFQVLRCIGLGRTVKEIAAEFNLSVKTISTYRARILQKMEMKRNADLMRYCLQSGLLAIESIE
jgi:two-component system invasion response regulator UvrY